MQVFHARFALANLDATSALGARIASELRKGDAVALKGDLGAGKTTLARAILAALGYGDAVPSPTFTLVQHYETAKLAVSHFDLYRLAHADELDELGLDEALSEGAALIEWPERAEGRLPDDALRIELQACGEVGRTVVLSGPARWASLLSDGEGVG